MITALRRARRSAAQTSLLDLLFGREPGDVVTVTVERDGATETFEVTLGERPEITE